MSHSARQQDFQNYLTSCQARLVVSRCYVRRSPSFASRDSDITGSHSDVFLIYTRCCYIKRYRTESKRKGWTSPAGADTPAKLKEHQRCLLPDHGWLISPHIGAEWMYIQANVMILVGSIQHPGTVDNAHSTAFSSKIVMSGTYFPTVCSLKTGSLQKVLHHQTCQSRDREAGRRRGLTWEQMFGM